MGLPDISIRHAFILAKYFPEYKPSATTGWIFHIKGKSPSYKNVRKGDVAKPRFKASRHDKDLAQLEDYKARNLTTFKVIADLVFNGRSPQWNTNVCHFLFGRKCEYLPIHETQPSEWNYIIPELLIKQQNGTPPIQKKATLLEKNS